MKDIKLALKVLRDTTYHMRNKFQVFKHESELPSLNYTLDGKLIGDIGEYVVMKAFDLVPFTKNEWKENRQYDAKSKDGLIKVQIKTTQGNSVPLGWHGINFDYLIAIKIDYDSENHPSFSLLFNGPTAELKKEREKSQDITCAHLLRVWEKTKLNNNNRVISLIRNLNDITE